MFNGKISYRIVKTDSVDDATISVPDAQVDNSEDERTDANKTFLEENTTNILKKQDEKVSVLRDKKFSSLIKYIEKTFHILEDYTTGMQNTKKFTKKCCKSSNIRKRFVRRPP